MWMQVRAGMRVAVGKVRGGCQGTMRKGLKVPGMALSLYYYDCRSADTPVWGEQEQRGND